MYMRVLQLKIDPLKSQAFQTFYDENIVPALQKVHGCLSITLVRSTQHNDEFLSVTFWNKQKDAEAFNQSKLFQQLLTKTKVYFSDSSEWKIKLSEDYTLDLEAVVEEPTVNSYPIVAQSDLETLPVKESQSMFMRIVSAKILPDKMDEIKQLYKNDVLPALKNIAGCRYACLSESMKDDHEIFSVTIWDSRQDVEAYEKSGLFEEFTERAKHTFSALSQWKMILDTDYDEKTAKSKAVDVNYYNIISGRSFK